MPVNSTAGDIYRLDVRIALWASARMIGAP